MSDKKRANQIIDFAVAVVYFGISAVFTYPLVFNMRTSVYGFANDNYGTIWSMWWLKYAFLHNMSAAKSPFLSAPFGMDFGAVPMQPYERYLGLLFSLAGGEVFAYNILILLGFVLSGITMYYLALYVTKNRTASFIAGLVYAFSPFHLAMSMQYIPLSSIQWIPLFALCLLRLRDRMTIRNAIYCGLSFALVFLTSFYYGVYSAVIALVFIAVFIWFDLAKAVKERGQGTRWGAALATGAKRIFTVKNIAVAFTFAAAGLAAIIPFVYQFIGNAAATVSNYGHPISESIRYSAHPWSFILPTLDNPVFGRLTSDFIKDHLFASPSYEQSLYVGIIPVVLAVYGLLRLRKDESAKRRFAGIFFFLAGAVALVFSIGPYIPLDPLRYYPDYMNHASMPKIPSLGLLLVKIAPMFRFLARFDVLIVLSLALLCGLGYRYLDEKLKNRGWLKPAAAIAVVLFILLEYANVPPFHSVNLAKTPAVYTWLKQTPGDPITVEYPFDETMAPRSLYYSFYQTRHEKRIMNFAFGEQARDWREKTKDIENPLTPAKLGELGVDYVIIHTKLPARTYPPYQPRLPDDSMTDVEILPDYGLKLEKKFADALVYRVVKPEKSFSGIIVKLGTGFGYTETMNGTGDWRWTDEEAALNIANLSGAEQAVDVSFDAMSFNIERSLTLELNGQAGKKAGLRKTPEAYLIQGIKLKRGNNTIIFRANPGSVSIDSVMGNGDGRRVSYAIGNIKVKPAGGQGKEPDVVMLKKRD